ncbi:MAG: phytanoyl-CoA dioxygenase family protein [Pseudomonadota bacterium]
MTTDQLAREGRVWLRNAVTKDDLAKLNLTFSGQRPGARIDHFSLPPSVAASIGSLWPRHAPVRVVAFEKTGAVNWSVPWHQDRVITVADRHDVSGFTNWSRKAGTWHCEPPLDVLAEMLFVRVHLDRNDADNGAMEIALGSHKTGLINSTSAADAAESYPVELCTAEPGDILVLSMLMLHRSRPSTSMQPRRALRIDFSDQVLPAPLRWKML